MLKKKLFSTNKKIGNNNRVYSEYKNKKAIFFNTFLYSISFYGIMIGNWSIANKFEQCKKVF